MFGKGKSDASQLAARMAADPQSPMQSAISSMSSGALGSLMKGLGVKPEDIIGQVLELHGAAVQTRDLTIQTHAAVTQLVELMAMARGVNALIAAGDALAKILDDAVAVDGSDYDALDAWRAARAPFNPAATKPDAE